jgi:peptidoglycan/xylan/chitin deacetylase (PgdA/CDA1 family)
MFYKNANKVKVCYGVDVDAVAGWLGSYGGENSPCDISRGVYAGRKSIPQLLELFDKHSIKATFFTPGHSIETFPKEIDNILKMGHELALHGYSHENPLALTKDQEEQILNKTIDLIKKVSGRAPLGYRAPWWEFSKYTSDLLLKYNIVYDSSLMENDFECYFVRKGDKWYPIDYSKNPDTWMRPMEFGVETNLVEIPANWYLDDLPPMMFIKSFPNSFGWVSPDVVLKLWMDQFEYLYNWKGSGVFPLTIHPDVSGRPQCILMHDKFISYLKGFPGVTFHTYEEIAKDFLSEREGK